VPPRNWTNAKWADYDNDGDPDPAFMSNYGSGALFRNDGGVFSNVTPAVLDSADEGDGLNWVDYDNDGNLDLYCVSDFNKNRLLRNDGGGVFTDVTTAPLDDAGTGYQAAAGDMDGDGDLDLFLANSYSSPNFDRVFRNDGNLSFTDVTLAGLVDSTDTRGVCLTDYDLDGQLDFVLHGDGANRLVTGVNCNLVELFPSALTNNTALATAASLGDADGDGDPDLYLVISSLFGTQNQYVRNDLCNNNAWIKIDLQGVVSNRDGIGARVFVHTPGGVVARRDMSGAGAGSGGAPFLLTVGLGSATVVDSIVVLWPSGVRQTLVAPAPYQTVNIVEDTSSISVPDGGDPARRSLLYAAAPNPFHGSTSIRFDLAAPGPAELAVYDVRGRRVRTLVHSDRLTPGSHKIRWDGRNDTGTPVASGVYFYRFRAGDARLTRKMILLR